MINSTTTVSKEQPTAKEVPAIDYLAERTMALYGIMPDQLPPMVQAFRAKFRNGYFPERTDKCCGFCSHWRQKGGAGSDDGECRAAPPRQSLRWPQTAARQFCGRYSAGDN